eukprot:5340321-Pyramimonas_sp.AAC.1
MGGIVASPIFPVAWRTLRLGSDCWRGGAPRGGTRLSRALPVSGRQTLLSDSGPPLLATVCLELLDQGVDRLQLGPPGAP